MAEQQQRCFFFFSLAAAERVRAQPLPGRHGQAVRQPLRDAGRGPVRDAQGDAKPGHPVRVGEPGRVGGRRRRGVGGGLQLCAAAQDLGRQDSGAEERGGPVLRLQRVCVLEEQPDVHRAKVREHWRHGVVDDADRAGRQLPQSTEPVLSAELGSGGSGGGGDICGCVRHEDRVDLILVLCRARFVGGQPAVRALQDTTDLFAAAVYRVCLCAGRRRGDGVGGGELCGFGGGWGETWLDVGVPPGRGLPLHGADCGRGDLECAGRAAAEADSAVLLRGPGRVLRAQEQRVVPGASRGQQRGGQPEHPRPRGHQPAERLPRAVLGVPGRRHRRSSSTVPALSAAAGYYPARGLCGASGRAQ